MRPSAVRTCDPTTTWVHWTVVAARRRATPLTPRCRPAAPPTSSPVLMNSMTQRRSRSWSHVSVWSRMQGDQWSSVLSAKPGFISHVQKSARTMSLKCTPVSCVETPNSLPANQIVSELRITSLQRSLVLRQLSRCVNGARCEIGARCVIEREREWVSAGCWQCYFYDNKFVYKDFIKSFCFIVLSCILIIVVWHFLLQILTTILFKCFCFGTGKQFFKERGRTP